MGGESGFPQRFVDEEGRGYEAAEELGRGVLTTVCRARMSPAGDDAHGDQLVLKTVLPLWVGHPLAEARIAREREVAASFPRPDDVRCARVIAGGRQADGRRSRPFHVSRRLLGDTLAHRLAAGRVSSDVALKWLGDILRTLACVHEAGWVHRDVKPQNLFVGGLTADCVPEPWLIDFGLALPMGRARRDGDDAFGTPAYVSPEVIAGAPVDQRADLYSVGLVAYELLTGTRPFCTRDPVALLDAHLSDTPPLLRTHAPSLSPELERVIASTLEKAPTERPASAAELAARLAACPDSHAAAAPIDCHARANG